MGGVFLDVSTQNRHPSPPVKQGNAVGLTGWIGFLSLALRASMGLELKQASFQEASPIIRIRYLPMQCREKIRSMRSVPSSTPVTSPTADTA